MSIAEKVREIIKEAIKRVSDGGQMKFSVRNLYYAVREIYLKRYPDEKFYKYNSFTQDFMRSYEKRYGKVKDLVREARGSYQRPDAGGWSSEDNIKTETYFWAGIGTQGSLFSSFASSRGERSCSKRIETIEPERSVWPNPKTQVTN